MGNEKHPFNSQELEPGVATPLRLRAMKELHEIVATKRLEEVGRE